MAEMLIWSNGFINIGEMDRMDVFEFDAFREMFKKKYEEDADSKKEFTKATFEFARKGIETICKTISAAFGAKSGSGPKIPSAKV
jgi:hypothetical protein